MGVHILEGTCNGDARACLVDSVTGLAFGPLFDSHDEAYKFLCHLVAGGSDPRSLTPDLLVANLVAWRARPRATWTRNHDLAAEAWNALSGEAQSVVENLADGVPDDVAGLGRFMLRELVDAGLAEYAAAAHSDPSWTWTDVGRALVEIVHGNVAGSAGDHHRGGKA